MIQAYRSCELRAAENIYGTRQKQRSRRCSTSTKSATRTSIPPRFRHLDCARLIGHVDSDWNRQTLGESGQDFDSSCLHIKTRGFRLWPEWKGTRSEASVGGIPVKQRKKEPEELDDCKPHKSILRPITRTSTISMVESLLIVIPKLAKKHCEHF